jgi:hypothetical protein
MVDHKIFPNIHNPSTVKYSCCHAMLLICHSPHVQAFLSLLFEQTVPAKTGVNAAEMHSHPFISLHSFKLLLSKGRAALSGN